MEPRILRSIAALTITACMVALTYECTLAPAIKYEESIITWTAHGHDSHLFSTVSTSEVDGDSWCDYHVWVVETSVGFHYPGCNVPDWSEHDMWRRDMGNCPINDNWGPIIVNSSDAVALSQLKWASMVIYLNGCHHMWYKYSAPYGFWIIIMTMECMIGPMAVYRIWNPHP
jgi:hypothetical protein